MQQDASNIADDLKQAPEQHADHEPGGAPSHAEANVNEAGKGVEGEEEAVGGEGGLVLVDAPFDGAEGEGAVCVGAEDDYGLAGGESWFVGGHD